MKVPKFVILINEEKEEKTINSYLQKEREASESVVFDQ